MKRFCFSILLAAILATVMAATAPSAAAAVSLVGPSVDPTGLDDLLIGTTTYDVTFVYGSYEAAYSTPPTFLQNRNGAVLATQAISSALTELGATASAHSDYDLNILVPYLPSAAPEFLVVSAASQYPGSSPWVEGVAFNTTETQVVTFNGYAYEPYAVFTPLAAVPETST
jgi:hypothetical protein